MTLKILTHTQAQTAYNAMCCTDGCVTVRFYPEKTSDPAIQIAEPKSGGVDVKAIRSGQGTIHEYYSSHAEFIAAYNLEIQP